MKCKTLLSLILTAAVALVLSGCGNKSESSAEISQTVPTETTPSATETAAAKQEYVYDKYLISPYIARSLKPDEQLYKKLFDMVENADEQVDISEFTVEQDTFERTAMALMDRLEFPYIKKIVTNDGKTAIAEYSAGKAEALAMRDKFRGVVENILSTEVSPSQNQTRNALAIYDYLCKNVTYAAGGEGNGGYDALVNGTAICYGYSYSLVYLLDQIGIESHITSSADESHMWVIAELDGKYRHLDPTNGWSQFGLSDEAQKRNYSDWYCGNMNYLKETPPTCTDKTYDFLLDSYSISYDEEKGILRYKDATNTDKEFTLLQ